MKNPNRYEWWAMFGPLYLFFYCISFGLTCRWGREAMPSTGIKTQKQHSLHIQHLCPYSWLFFTNHSHLYFLLNTLPQWIIQFTSERNNTQNIQRTWVLYSEKTLANVLSSATASWPTVVLIQITDISAPVSRYLHIFNYQNYVIPWLTSRGRKVILQVH